MRTRTMWSCHGLIGKVLALTALSTGLAAFGSSGATSGSVSAPTSTTKDSAPGASYNPETDTTTGVLRLARIEPGESYYVVGRPNHQQIKIPYLRASGTSALTAESALAIFAGYLTTGDTRLENAFTSDAALKAWMEHVRSQEGIDKAISGGNTDIQVSIFDDPANQAVFTEGTDSSGRRTITLSGGTVYLRTFWAQTSIDNHFNPDNTWQGKGSHYKLSVDRTSTSLFTQMVFHLGPGPDGTPGVQQFDANLDPA